jgi:hypothetical protein
MKREDIAMRIVHLYFEEIARLGFKRQLDLDQIIGAYFYTLTKLESADKVPASVPSENPMQTQETTTKVTTTTITQQ